MRTIRATLALLMLGGAVCAAWGQQPAGPKPDASKGRKPVPWPATWAKIVDEKVIFQMTVDMGIATRRAPGPMKLSADGRRLLYIRRVLKRDRQGKVRRGHALILMDLETRRQKLLPVPFHGEPCNEMLLLMFSMNVFDADGERMVLAAGVDRNNNGLHDTREERQQLALYDIPKGRLNRLDLTGQRLVATFDRTGGGLIVWTLEVRQEDAVIYTTPADELKLKKLNLWGLLLGGSPVADVIPLLLPPVRKGPQGAGELIPPRLVLYDVKKEKVTATLPTRERSTFDLKRRNPQWTADGRFLYYIDVVAEAGGDRQKQQRRLTRIWDRKGNKLSREIPYFVAVGPGPTPTTMMLTSYDGGQGMAIHDAASNKAWLVQGQWVRLTGALGNIGTYTGLVPVRLISTQGKYLLYVRRFREHNKWMLCRGRIELPLPMRDDDTVSKGVPIPMMQRKISSPKEALQNMARALRYGNRYAFVACFDVEPEQMHVLEALAGLRIAQTRLFQAIMATYGPDALEKHVTERLKDEGWIEEVTFKVSGDKATCMLQPEQSTKHFVKKDGSWKIVAHDIATLTPERVILISIAAEVYKAALAKIGKEGYTPERILEELDLPRQGLKKAKPAPTTRRGS